MYHFFVSDDQVGESEICLTGKDVNHIKNVLRMKMGETLSISAQKEYDYLCSIKEIGRDQILLQIEDIVMEGTELPCEITLFQGLAKGEKMDWIIQKCVELGAARIVPVAMKRSVVKLDAKKAEAKSKRWNAIAESAAKQAGRSCIPMVSSVMTMQEALEEGKKCERRFLPYEGAKGMKRTRKLFSEISAGESIAVFIGPEGGFSDEEVEEAIRQGYEPMTLGKRILRTETAGMTVLGILMYLLEQE